MGAAKSFAWLGEVSLDVDFSDENPGTHSGRRALRSSCMIAGDKDKTSNSIPSRERLHAPERLSDKNQSQLESTHGTKVSTDNHGLDHVHFVVSYDGLDCSDAWMVCRNVPIFPNHRGRR